MQFVAYLTFNGKCREAFQFYADLLGATIEMMQAHGETPAAEHVPADWQDKIMHARLRAGDAVLMGSDAPPQYMEHMAGFSVALQAESVEEAERIFAGLADGGQVTMPIGETFWAKRFGMVKDRFGTPWMVNCDS